MEGLNYDERISGKCIDVAQEQRSERDNSLSLSMNVVKRGSTFTLRSVRMTLRNIGLTHTHILTSYLIIQRYIFKEYTVCQNISKGII